LPAIVRRAIGTPSRDLLVDLDGGAVCHRAGARAARVVEQAGYEAIDVFPETGSGARSATGAGIANI